MAAVAIVEIYDYSVTDLLVAAIDKGVAPEIAPNGSL
jgi:hypothetical protein